MTKGRIIRFLLALLCIPLIGYGAPLSPEPSTDSLEISFLTCSPHQEVYSLYGHTALRVQDQRTGQDFVVNYGMFSFNQPYFILRFVFGLTDYRMGVTDFASFCREYQYYGSSVTQQDLDLMAEEKNRIMAALAENARPENVTYRYNFFYDNCTTRARDMILTHLDGRLSYTNAEDSATTFRKMVHSCNEEHPWARFGNDMLLGFQADLTASRNDRQFLPINTCTDLSHAVVTTSDGQSRRLVKHEFTVVEGGVQVVESEFPLRPLTCSILLLALCLVILLWEYWRRRVAWGYDALLLTLSGIAGIVLTLMLFSEHPTVRFNLQLLLLNPLPLLLVYPVVRRESRRKPHWWWTVGTCLIFLFFAGNIFQDYAEGMNILALSLLSRYVSRRFIFRRAVERGKS